MIVRTLLPILCLVGQGEGQTDEQTAEPTNGQETLGAHQIKTVFERFNWSDDLFSWSNDETRIFFLDRKKGYDLCEYNFESDEVRVLVESFSKKPGKLMVTPDDRQIVFYSEDRAIGNLFKVIALDTLEVRSLSVRANHSGVITPDGEFLLVWGKPADKRTRTPVLLRIPLAIEPSATKVLFNPAGRAEIRRDDRIAFSKDGTLIAVTYREKTSKLGEAANVMLARIDDSGIGQRIEFTGPVTMSALAFAEPGQLLISGQWADQGNAVATIKASQAMERGNVTDGDWRWRKNDPTYIAVSPDGRFVAVALHKARARRSQTSTGVYRNGANAKMVRIATGWDHAWAQWSPLNGFLICYVGTRNDAPRYDVFSLDEIEIGCELRSFKRQKSKSG